MAHSETERFASNHATSYSTTDIAIGNASDRGMNDKTAAEEQRDALRTVGNFDAYVAFVKGNLGTGVLALPFAFAQAGWAAGAPLFIVVVVQGTYVFLVLAECKRAVARPGVTDLGDVAQVALGSCGRFVADLCVFILQSGVCTVSVTMVAESLAVSTGMISQRIMTLLLAPLFAAIAMLRFVAQLSWLNKFGSMAMAVAVITSIVCGVRQLGEAGHDGALRHTWPRRPFSDPVMLATSVFFAFEGLGLVLPIEKEMVRPSAFPAVATLASVTLAIAFLSVSFVCGMAYGGELEPGSIVRFQASQPGTGAGHTFLQVTDHLVAAAIFLTYPMQLLPTADILAAVLDRRATSADAEAAGFGACRLRVVPGWVWQRLILVVSHVLIAVVVKNVSLLVSLFGAVGQTGLGILVPLCHLALRRSGALNVSTPRAALDWAIVMFCMVLMVYGTQRAFRDIIAQW